MEALRQRERLVRLEGRVDAHDRGLGELRDYGRETRRRVDAMSKADEIAEAVTTALQGQREQDRKRWFRSLGVGKQIAIACGSAVLLIPAVHDGVGWLF